MARRQWTLLLLSDEDTAVRQFAVSGKLVRTGITIAIAVLVILSLLSTGFFVKQSQSTRAKQLAKENELLAAELDVMRSNLAQLEESLAELSTKDEHYRLLAGLEPIDEEIRLAGIGGPGTATLAGSELYRLNPERGRVAFSTAHELNAMLRRADILASSLREATETLSAEHDRLESYPSILPTRGYVSSEYSRSRWHPILNRPRPHEGMDVSAPRGTPIVAAAKGRVTYVGWRGDYGNLIEIDHGNGLVTRYAHASRTLVRRGQLVNRWDKIGEVGDTGLATGPHLHYEVLQNGRPVNPRQFIYGASAILD
jgi:hypothetical protein